jgi:glucosamine--fructose-6-phosphate aminotransferase (isomerizing)
MLRQADAIIQTLQAAQNALAAVADHLATTTIHRIIIAGCGDSWFTGMAVRLTCESLLGIPTEAIQAFDYAHYYHRTTDAHTLMLGLSASGNTPAVLEAVHVAREHGAITIGVTNTPGSPLATASEYALTVHATRRGWPTQSSTAAIALLQAFAVELATRWKTTSAENCAAFRADLLALPHIVTTVTERYDATLRTLAASLAATRIILFTGAGPHFATAAFGAAKIKELSPIHAVAFPLEEYHHYRSQKSGDPLFLVAPDDASHQRALDTALVGHALKGQTTVLIPEDEQEIRSFVTLALPIPRVRIELTPILYSIPLHLFAYHFAMARFERGLGYPGAFPITLSP